MAFKKWIIAGLLSMMVPLMAQPEAAAMDQQAGKAAGIYWHADAAKAMQMAQQQNKPVVLFFTGSDWCGYCIKMHNEIWSKPDVNKELAPYFVFVDVDCPKKKQIDPAIKQQNNALVAKYGVTGFPTVWVVDSQGKCIKEVQYQPGTTTADFIRTMKGIISK